jgi:hypothetical protein
MNLPAQELGEAERESARSARAAAMKFAYPSGSRPLEGYTVKRGVGRGGFGEVYFATSDAGKEVALKLIRRNLEVELRGVTQCLNLKHSNLIGLYDIRTDETGDQWVIMEYVSGESLEDTIERHPTGMPLEDALWWMRGICSGVAYLHDHGIVHRDLKPGNIFSDEGTVKIGDYGLAKFISCSRRSGQTESVGTVHYMAPEIANGRYGREIDTYARAVRGRERGRSADEAPHSRAGFERARRALSRDSAARPCQGSQCATEDRQRNIDIVAGRRGHSAAMAAAAAEHCRRRPRRVRRQFGPARDSRRRRCAWCAQRRSRGCSELSARDQRPVRKCERRN